MKALIIRVILDAPICGLWCSIFHFCCPGKLLQHLYIFLTKLASRCIHDKEDHEHISHTSSSHGNIDDHDLRTDEWTCYTAHYTETE